MTFAPEAVERPIAQGQVAAPASWALRYDHTPSTPRPRSEGSSSPQVRRMKSAPAFAAPAQAYEPGAADFFALMKPRVMSLVIFTAMVGLAAAPTHPHPLVALAALLCVAAGAGASGALNMWWDADIDAKMKRTVNRPIPAGKATPGDALGLGVGVSIVSVMMLTVFGNLVAAGLLAFTIFFYAVIYTMWLKRATPQNIVIGGAAGAFPPMIGWAIATGGVSIESVLMFAVIFLWTPPHFWALALWRRQDYEDVGVPMLPVVSGEAETRKQIFFYAVLLAPVCGVLAFTSAGGPITAAATLIANAAFVRGAWAVWRRKPACAEADGYGVEKRLFRTSLLYLAGIFAAVLIDAGLRSAGLALNNWPVLFG